MKNKQSFLGCVKSKQKNSAFYHLMVQLSEKADFDGTTDTYYQFGYEVFGVVLYGFCRWLFEELEKSKVKKVLFFSRDGHIMKEAFDLFPKSQEFEDEYVYVSRRSLRVPQLWIENKSRKDLIIPTRYISLEDLFSSIGINIDDYENTVRKSGLDKHQIIHAEDLDNAKISNLIDNIWTDVIQNSKSEYKALQQYIEQFNLNGEVAVVDIGWRGSMQSFLQRILDTYKDGVRLSGYYITLSGDFIHGQKMKGYLGNVDDQGSGCNLLRGYVGLLELLFSYEEGSVEKYDISGTVPKPVLYESEYTHLEEGFYDYENIKRLQKGALDFVKMAVADEKMSAMNIDYNMAFSVIESFANNPSMDNVQMFDRFRFLNNATAYHLIESRPFDHYLKHPSDLKKDLYLSRWRTGFLRKVFRIDLPYHAMFRMMLWLANLRGN